MEISATVRNSQRAHEVVVRSGTVAQPLGVAAKPAGRGSAVGGGEFLMLALATCYCNGLYQEVSS